LLLGALGREAGGLSLTSRVRQQRVAVLIEAPPRKCSLSTKGEFVAGLNSGSDRSKASNYKRESIEFGRDTRFSFHLVSN
jgi:hypothetical protein